MTTAPAPNVMDVVAEMVLDGDRRRWLHADRVWDVLSSTERLLFAEAAVLGFAAGVHDHAPTAAPVRIVPPEHIAPVAIAFHVISTCTSMSDLHRHLGSITGRRRPRNSGQPLLYGVDIRITRDLLDYHSDPQTLTEQRAARALHTWNALSLPEMKLVKDAAVTAYVNAVRNHGSLLRATIPSDRTVICKVLDTAVQFTGQFPTLGGALADRRARRKET